MKVAIVSPTAPPFDSSSGIFGGAETYSVKLALELVKLNHDVTFLTVANRSHLIQKPPHLRLNYLKQNRLLTSSMYDQNTFDIIKELNANNYDVIHIHQLCAGFSVFAGLSARLTKTPCFLTDHGGGSRFLYAMPQVCALIPDHFMAVSQYSLKWLRSFAPYKESSIVYGGIDLETFCPNDDFEAVRQKLNLPSDALIVLFVGKVAPHKGLEVLIRAFKFLPKKTVLLVVGPTRDPHYLAYLENLANTICSNLMIVLGSVPDNLLPKLYNLCDVFVLPSVYTDYLGNNHRFSELLGLVKFEAMACGKPVVVSNVGGLPEYVVNGENGFVFSTGNERQLSSALNKLLSDATLRKTMGLKGLRLVQQKFSWRVIAQNIEYLYKAAIKKS